MLPRGLGAWNLGWLASASFKSSFLQMTVWVEVATETTDRLGRAVRQALDEAKASLAGIPSPAAFNRFVARFVGLVGADGRVTQKIVPGLVLSHPTGDIAGEDSNLRPPGYEPDELPGCSTPRLSPAILSERGVSVKRWGWGLERLRRDGSREFFGFSGDCSRLSSRLGLGEIVKIIADILHRRR